MIWDYLVRGILIGLIFGVPAGAIGALTIQRTVEKGFIAGFITVLGISVLRKKERTAVMQETKGSLVFCFLSSFGTAVMNPATILSFMVAFAAFEINEDVSAAEGVGLILGILAGTLGWWFALSGGVSLVRERITDRIYMWLNRILGSFMTMFGMVMVVRGTLAISGI